MAGATTQGANLLIRGKLTIHTHSYTVGAATRAIGVKCLAQGHMDMWTEGAGNLTPDSSTS